MTVYQNQTLLNSAIKIERKYPVNMTGSDVADFNDEKTYKTSDCYLKSFKNVRVSPDSVIYKNGIVVDETLYLSATKSYYQTRYLLKKILTGKRIKLKDNKKYLLATDQESAGHFHWFTEIIPRLFCVKEIASEFTLLLPNHPYILKIALESLKILNINFQDIILMESQNFYSIKDLHYVTKISRTGQPNDEIMKKINEHFLSNKTKGTKKIYVSREKALFRKVLNENELFNKLNDYGFEVLHGEEYSVAEQIDIFSQCETLLGIHGAGLTNCLFMFPQSKVIELRRKETANNNGYWHLADSLNHNYYYHNGIPDSEKSIIGNGCNLTIPIERFETEILKYL